MERNPYATTYVPGYSYSAPSSWQTERKKIPICVSGEKKVSAPAFVFGSGVPANALEMEGTGAGQTGSMMPRFTYREEESGIWSDNPMYKSEHK